MKKMCVFVVICFLALGLIAMSGQAVALEKVRLVFPNTSYAVWFNEMVVGLPESQDGLGFYEEEGLDVQYSAAPGSTAAIQLVAAGQAEIAGMAGQ